MQARLGISSNSILSATQDGVISIFDFQPRSEEHLRKTISELEAKRLFYFQRPNEQFSIGNRYSFIFYSKNISDSQRDCNISNSYQVTYGMSDEISRQSFDLASELNEDQIIFPNTMKATHHSNSNLVNKGGLAVNIFYEKMLVGHLSVIRQRDQSLNTDEEHYILMRFLVHRDHRRPGGIKELLMHELASFVPTGKSLSLQVFPNNKIAQKFFSRRMNVVPFLEKWVVDKSKSLDLTSI